MYSLVSCAYVVHRNSSRDPRERCVFFPQYATSAEYTRRPLEACAAWQVARNALFSFGSLKICCHTCQRRNTEEEREREKGRKREEAWKFFSNLARHESRARKRGRGSTTARNNEDRGCRTRLEISRRVQLHVKRCYRVRSQQPLISPSMFPTSPSNQRNNILFFRCQERRRRSFSLLKMRYPGGQVFFPLLVVVVLSRRETRLVPG